MQALKEIAWERKVLLAEHRGLETILEYLRDHQASRQAVSAKDLAARDQATRKLVQDVLRGGFIRKGMWRLEMESHRYFQELLQKIRVLPGEKNDQIQQELRTYEARLVKRASRQGTITSLIAEEQVDWEKLQGEVIEMKTDIAAMIVLLDKATKHLQLPPQQFVEWVIEIGAIGGQLSPEAAELSSWKPSEELSRLLLLHVKDIERFIERHPSPYVTAYYVLRLGEAVENYHLPWGFVHYFFTHIKLSEESIGSFPDFLHLHQWRLLKEEFYPAIVRIFQKGIDLDSFSFFDDALTDLIKNKEVPPEQALDIIVRLSSTTVFDYFKYEGWGINRQEIMDFFFFCEGVTLLCQKERIQYVYAIDRSGRILGFLIQRVFSHLKKKISVYYIFCDHPRGVVAFYNQRQKGEILSKNVLVIDEYTQTGETLKLVTAALRQAVGPQGKVVAVAWGARYHATEFKVLCGSAPSWAQKERFSGMEEEGNRVKVSPALITHARKIRKSLSELAPIIATYLKCRGLG